MVFIWRCVYCYQLPHRNKKESILHTVVLKIILTEDLSIILWSHFVESSLAAGDEVADLRSLLTVGVRRGLTGL